MGISQIRWRIGLQANSLPFKFDLVFPLSAMARHCNTRPVGCYCIEYCVFAVRLEVEIQPVAWAKLPMGLSLTDLGYTETPEVAESTPPPLLTETSRLPGFPTQAERADRFQLYERAVQCPEAEVDFLDTTFWRLRHRLPRVLREDFCGAGALCCEWVRRRVVNRALGVDIDGEVLAWGRQHHLAGMEPALAQRVQLLQQDVLEVETAPADIICALNFSYWLLVGRARLKQYFIRVLHALAEGGVFFLDAYGGYDSFREIVEEREFDTFSYVWEQEKFDPISGRLICHIHFRFPDGSRLERAFSYDWRLWTLPEIRELLAEAGFDNITVYWQGWDRQGQPNGAFLPVTEGKADAGWICYLTAEKPF